MIECLAGSSRRNAANQRLLEVEPDDLKRLLTLHFSMSTYTPIQLSRLRNIGWKLWDPIGLACNDGSPDPNCADEYDRYLLHTAGLIRRGASEDEAQAYLIEVASVHMGLSYVDQHAAAATASAIADYITSLDGPKMSG